MINKAVVMGANQYLGLSVSRSLGEKGIPIVAVVVEDFEYTEDYGFFSKYIKEKVFVPHYDTKADRGLIVQRLNEFASKEPVKPVLIPTADPHVEIIDEFFEELREFYLLPSMPKGLYSELLDKDTLYHKCVEHGVLVPKSLIPVKKPGFAATVKNEVGFPCLVKPVNSFEFNNIFKATKLFVVNNEEELMNSLQMAWSANQEVIIQQLIKGFDDQMYCYDAYIDSEGELTHWSTCQKIRQYPINYGSSTYIKQKYVQQIADIGGEFLKAIGYRGFAEVEFKKDAEDGRFYLIEVNVRITTFNRLLKQVGFNVPLIWYNDVTGRPINSKLELKWDTGWHFWYPYLDMFTIKSYLLHKQLSSWSIFKSLFAKKKTVIWSWKDIRPGLKAFVMFANKILNLKRGTGRAALPAKSTAQ